MTSQSPPGSSVHGISQARILEWVAISFSRGSFWPRDQTQVSCIADRFSTVWVTSFLTYLLTIIWYYRYLGTCKCSSEKAMAPHSSTLAWKIPWTERPGRLQSMGLLGVEHDWATSHSLFTFMHWRRKWQPTPVFLSGESQGWVSLVGCRLGSHRVGHDWSDLSAVVAYYLLRVYLS